MKIQVFGLIFFSALGLAHGLAIDSNNKQEGVQLAKRNNWDKPSSSVDHPNPHPTPVHDKSKDGHEDTKGKDCDDDKKKHGDNDKNKDGHSKDKGKDRDKNLCKDPSKCATTVDPPIDLPPPGVAIDKPYPQFDSTPGVPPTKDGDIDGTSMDENDPRVILVGTYIERLARQTAPITIPFQGDTGRIYNEQDAVTILDDQYCVEDISGYSNMDYNCTADTDSDRYFARNDGNADYKRSVEAGTYAIAVPQIYRWRHGSRITIVVERNNKLVWMNLNQGITGATPAWVSVRASEITAAAMTKAIRYWNAADIGVRFVWSRSLTKSTYLTRTGGSKGIALATADAPQQDIGYQHLISAWDIMIEVEWHPVGPNILSHELGHALGLNHNDPKGNYFEIWDGTGDSIMDSSTSSDTNVITAIPDRDVTGASILYTDFQPPKTRGRVVALLRPPQGPVPAPRRYVFNPPKCSWSISGRCIYY